MIHTKITPSFTVAFLPLPLMWKEVGRIISLVNEMCQWPIEDRGCGLISSTGAIMNVKPEIVIPETMLQFR